MYYWAYILVWCTSFRNVWRVHVLMIDDDPVNWNILTNSHPQVQQIEWIYLLTFLFNVTHLLVAYIWLWGVIHSHALRLISVTDELAYLRSVHPLNSAEVPRVQLSNTCVTFVSSLLVPNMTTSSRRVPFCHNSTRSDANSPPPQKYSKQTNGDFSGYN